MFYARLRPIRRCILTAGLLLVAASSRADGLEEALQAALSGHPAVAGQTARVEASRSAASSARSQRYPSLSAQAQQYTQGGPSGVDGEQLSQPGVLRLRQPIWSFGRISSSISAATARVNTERATLLRVSRQLLEDTAVAYALAFGSRQLVDVSRQNVSEHEALLAQIERRVEGRLASSADARLAATRLLQARAALERAVSDLEIARQDLAALTQNAARATQPVPRELLDMREASALLDSALANSAEIQVRKQRLGEAEAAVDEARTSYLPTIYLQADRFNDQPGLRDDNQVSLVIEASLDGAGFAARGRTAEAVASRTAASQDLAAARLELRRELERLQRNRRLQEELVALQSRALEDLESLMTSYQRQYESGSKSWLDLLNVQRELFEQRQRLVEARNGWMVDSLRLQARSGGLDELAGLESDEDD